MKILVTGNAGFIGFHLVNRLVKESYEIVGLDNINDYYDVNLKYARLKEAGISKDEIYYNKLIVSRKYKNYRFIKLDLTDKENILKLFKKEEFEYIINLAAQPGVRYSITHPDSYIQSNIVGFMNILEACRHNNIRHLVYASSSSVYGLNPKMPLSTSDNVDHPISLYAATKKSNELMAHTYCYLYNFPTTGLRFFTVYGPWGRPDMAYFKFAKAIIKDEFIDVYNNGNMLRDFTYIDDVTTGISQLLGIIMKERSDLLSNSKYRIYNLGNSRPVNLMVFINTIEKILEKKANKKYLAIQPGDLEETYADIEKSKSDFGYNPEFSLQDGLKIFIDWYREFYS